MIWQFQNTYGMSIFEQIWSFNSHFNKLIQGSFKVFSCEDAAQQVLMSVCPSVVNLKIYLTTSFYNIQDVLECSRMFQNVPECSRMFQDVPGCSGMFKDVQGCSRMSFCLSPKLKIPSVCIPLECTRTEHYSLTLTSLYNIVQVCITLYKSVQHCTSMYKIVQVCTSMQLQKNACSYISLHAVT